MPPMRTLLGSIGILVAAGCAAAIAQGPQGTTTASEPFSMRVVASDLALALVDFTGGL